MSKNYSLLRNPLAFCLLFLMIYGSGMGTLMAQTHVEARVDSRQLTIGDQFHLFLEARHQEQDGRLRWPAVPRLEGLEVVDTGRVDSVVAADGTVLYKQKLTLTGFDSGAYLIPPVAFAVVHTDGTTQTYESDSFRIQVQTVAVDTAKPIRPIKEIIAVPKRWWEYWPWALGALLLLVLTVGGVIWWRHRRRHAGRKAALPPEKAHEKALRLLEEMSLRPYQEQGKLKEYYTDLTNILRVYLEERYGIAAAELTTDELLRMAKQNRALKKIRQELKQIFLMADLVKFAKASPEAPEQIACMDAATKIIYKTTQEQEEGFTS